MSFAFLAHAVNLSLGEHTLLVLMKTIFRITFVALFLYALGEYILLHIFHFPLPTYNGRSIATLGSPIYFASFMVMLLPLILEEKKKGIISTIVYALLFFFILSITQTRSALLAFVITGTLYSMRSITFFRPIPKVLVTMAIVSISLAFLLAMFPFSSRFSVWDNQLLIWKNLVPVLPHVPLLGYGPEATQNIFPSRLHFMVDHAHNIFLETFFSSGIIGLLLFLGIVFVTLKNASFPIKLSLLAFLICAQFNPLSLTSFLLFWFLVGMNHRKGQILL
jgi:O-antigen ligase